MMTIYISGNTEETIISGTVVSEAVRQKFSKAEKMLEERGFEVINMFGEHMARSTEVAFRWRYLRPDFSHFLLYRLHWLLECNAIYMLPDFLDSPAAKVEHAFAIATGIVVYYDDELYADGTLRGKAYNEHRLPEVAP